MEQWCSFGYGVLLHVSSWPIKDYLQMSFPSFEVLQVMRFAIQLYLHLLQIFNLYSTMSL